MDNAKIDGLTKDILSGSKLEITNPDFNKIVMGKIKAENRKRIIYTNIKFYSLMFISIDAAILILLNLSGISISNAPSSMNAFSRAYENFYSNAEQLIFIYFVVLFAAILMIMVISRTGYSYSKTQEG